MSISHSVKIFCDMDGVLVKQTGRVGFNLMPWTPDGRAFWDVLKRFNPILLTQVPDERFGQSSHEKLIWIDRELGKDVPVIFTPGSRGKTPFASSGAVLIDDSEKHRAAWVEAGGIFLRHISTVESIERLRTLVK